MADFDRSSITLDRKMAKTYQEFISFNSPPQSRFSPINYSSPVRNNNYGKRTWNQSFGSNISYSQNNTGERYSGTSKRNFNNYSRNNSWSKNSQNTSLGSNAISSFLHPSFTEDPWKKLEEDFKRKDPEIKW